MIVEMTAVRNVEAIIAVVTVQRKMAVSMWRGADYMTQETGNTHYSAYFMIAVVVLVSVNHFINIISPVWIWVSAFLFLIVSIIFLGTIGDDRDKWIFDKQGIASKTCLTGILMLIVELALPYNIIFSFTDYILPNEIRSFFGVVAERMFYGLIILICIYVIIIFLIAYHDAAKHLS